MTSMLRKFSQISPREKYFTVLAPDQLYATVADGFTLHPLMTESEFMAAANFSFGFSPGELLKDLGRTVVTYDPTNRNLHTGVYRQVQLVNGLTTEGVGHISEIFYIRVWSADGDVTHVARTG